MGRFENQIERQKLPEQIDKELQAMAKATRLKHLNLIAKTYIKPEYLGRYSFFDAPLIHSITLVLDWGQAMGGQHWHFKKDQFLSMTDHQMVHAMLSAVKMA